MATLYTPAELAYNYAAAATKSFDLFWWVPPTTIR